MTSHPQTIIPFITFEGQAEEAMTHYVSAFKNAKLENIVRYGVDGPGPEGSVQTATFSINGQMFMCSDSFIKHDWDITPGVSFLIYCEDEDEIHSLFTKLTEEGKALMPLGDYGFGKRFGWAEDRFGVTWQLMLAE